MVNHEQRSVGSQGSHTSDLNDVRSTDAPRRARVGSERSQRSDVLDVSRRDATFIRIELRTSPRGEGMSPIASRISPALGHTLIAENSKEVFPECRVSTLEFLPNKISLRLNSNLEIRCAQ